MKCFLILRFGAPKSLKPWRDIDITEGKTNSPGVLDSEDPVGYMRALKESKRLSSTQLDEPGVAYGELRNPKSLADLAVNALADTVCARSKKTPTSQDVRRKLWRPLKQQLIETILLRNVFSSEEVAEKFLDVALLGAEVDKLFETKEQKKDRQELEERRVDVKINGPSFPKCKLTFQVRREQEVESQ